jgi:hypothetical protein
MKTAERRLGVVIMPLQGRFAFEVVMPLDRIGWVDFEHAIKARPGIAIFSFARLGRWCRRLALGGTGCACSLLWRGGLQ